MKFTFSNLPTIGWDEPIGRIVDLARLCEAVGFDRFGVSDWRFYHDCFVVMTACLAGTSRLAVEALVTDPYTRHPALTAAAIATMEDLAPGRVILGFGGGREQPSFWGEPRLHPVRAVREAVEVCRRLWAGEEVNLAGKVIRIQGARLSFKTRPAIPILVAARGTGMLRLAGEIADVAHLASFFINLTRYRDDLELVRAGASQAGRSLGDFEIDISMPACVSSDRERARRAAKRPAAHAILWMAAAERYSRDRPDWRPPKEFDVPHEVVDALATLWDPWTTPDLPDELADLILDPILDQFALAGTPDECAERLKAILEQRPEATGVRIRAIQPAGMPAYEGYAETVRGMGHVIDAVRRALPAAARQ